MSLIHHNGLKPFSERVESELTNSVLYVLGRYEKRTEFGVFAVRTPLERAIFVHVNPPFLCWFTFNNRIFSLTLSTIDRPRGRQVLENNPCRIRRKS